MIQEKRVWELFSELVSIDNPSLREEKMCQRIKIFLENLQIPYEEDDTGSKIGGTSGNLYAYVEGDNSLPPLLFSAHMDSVSPAVGKKAVLHEDGTITAGGSTVLGADDLSGICAILEALTSLKEDGTPHRPLELLFDVAEETYCAGIRQFDFSRLKSKEAYVFDLTGDIGGAAYQAPAIVSFTAGFTGKATHAAFSPEEGIHAIKAAALAVTAIPCGHVGETTVNIGTIKGGEADNVVPAFCELTGEVRGFDNDVVFAQLDAIRSIVEKIASDTGTAVNFSTNPLCLAYRVDPESPVANRFKRACTSVELKDKLHITYGGSDNNHFYPHGLNGLVVASGMNHCHGCGEYSRLSDLTAAAKLAQALMLSRE